MCEMDGLGKMIFEAVVPKSSQFSESHRGLVKKINFWAQQQGVLIQYIWGRLKIHSEISERETEHEES